METMQNLISKSDENRINDELIVAFCKNGEKITDTVYIIERTHAIHFLMYYCMQQDSYKKERLYSVLENEGIIIVRYGDIIINLERFEEEIRDRFILAIDAETAYVRGSVWKEKRKLVLKNG